MAAPNVGPSIFEAVKKLRRPNLSQFMAPKPTNVVSGVISCIGNTIGGAFIAIAIMIGVPLKSAIHGYSTGGAKGCTAGVFSGVVLGAAGGAAVVLYGAVSGIYQVTFGLIRTPSAVFAYFRGQDWDADVEEFVRYDLSSDSSLTLSFSDEALKAAVKERGSLAAVLRLKTRGVPTRENKYVKDTILYDVLGIDPGATQAEIRKAYHLKARQNHPDRNLSDSQAHASFQLIGEAYQVLSDERLRHAYDSRGHTQIQKSTEMHAGAVYGVLFGSESFDSVIGEPQLATQAKEMFAPDGDNSSDFLAFKQRRREVVLAVALAGKMTSFINGDVAVFIERCQAEADELAASPMGGALLGLIGGIYRDRARIETSLFEGCSVAFKQSGEALSDMLSITADLGSAIQIILDVEREVSQREEIAAAEDDRLGTPLEERDARSTQRLMDSFSTGNSASATMRPMAKALSRKMMGLAWQALKADVTSTLNSVCDKVLHDCSASKAVLSKRREALLILGSEYCNRSITLDLGLSDLVERVGQRTGLYGNPPPTVDGGNSDDDDAAYEEEGQDHNAEEEEGEHNTILGSPASFDDVAEVLSNLTSYSVKELKQRIVHFGGERVSLNNFFEKTELRLYLKEVMLSKLSVGELRTMLSKELQRINILDKEGNPAAYVTFADVVKDCDKQTIIGIFLKLDP